MVYFPNTNFCGLDALAYEICNNSGCDVATVNLIVTCAEPQVMTGFSPNGDGINDAFMIKNIDAYPDNELIIFDRWGNSVYDVENYNRNNLWRGEYRNLIVPDGTYFYIFKYEGGTMSGYVQINR